MSHTFIIIIKFSSIIMKIITIILILTILIAIEKNLKIQGIR